MISNSIIDINSSSTYDIHEAIKQLDRLNCFHLQIRFFNRPTNKRIQSILNWIDPSSFRTVEFFLPYYENSIFEADSFLLNNKRITGVIFFDTPKEKNKLSGVNVVSYLEKNILDCSSCGVITSQYFSATMNHFTESQHHNTCLNRKISIDVNGEIKNCPSMHKSYGNIKNTTLEEALNKQGFKNLWSIKKDDIKICQDCEFRHICTDCRAFIDNPDDIYSHPAKCTYNPYQAKWKGEDGYVYVTEMAGDEINRIKAENA